MPTECGLHSPAEQLPLEQQKLRVPVTPINLPELDNNYLSLSALDCPAIAAERYNHGLQASC